MAAVDAPTQQRRPSSTPLEPELRPRPRNPSTASPSRHAHISASPSRLRSSSPRIHSPASSEIFERNVQEPITISNLGNELSPAHIPAHVMTEDSIPPALEASAQAITSQALNPDDVEIVTSSSHQPAAASVLEASSSHVDFRSLSPPAHLRHETSTESDTPSNSGLEDDPSNTYAQLDPNDVRRLSFISFKDIVNSEHQHHHHHHHHHHPSGSSTFGDIGSRDSLHIYSTSISERAASPLRSPQSPNSTTHSLGGITTPPSGVGGATAGGMSPLTMNPEQSPARLGSPGGGNQYGELITETMTQSIRKTASGDLSGAKYAGSGSDGMRSAGLSPVGSDDVSFRTARNRTRTNS